MQKKFKKVKILVPKNVESYINNVGIENVYYLKIGNKIKEKA